MGPSDCKGLNSVSQIFMSTEISEHDYDIKKFIWSLSWVSNTEILQSLEFPVIRTLKLFFIMLFKVTFVSQSRVGEKGLFARGPNHVLRGLEFLDSPPGLWGGEKSGG